MPEALAAVRNVNREELAIQTQDALQFPQMHAENMHFQPDEQQANSTLTQFCR
jgi:hypothetical protein